MAINNYINVTLDASAGSKTDQYHVHTVSGSTSAASGGFSIGYDTAVITSLALFDSAYRAARLRAVAGGLK